MEERTKKFIDPLKAKVKSEKYCAYQERSQQEVRNKLYSWGLHKKDVEQIIADLITSGFLKEERFAVAYAGGKFRINGWGKIKIRLALLQKKIPEKIISSSLKEIPEKDYRKKLQKIIDDKLKSVTEKNSLKKNYKVAQYAISRGFEPELVWDLLKEENAF